MKSRFLYLFISHGTTWRYSKLSSTSEWLPSLRSIRWHAAKLSAAKLQECSAAFREEYLPLKNFYISICGADVTSLYVCSNFHTADDGALSGRCTFWTVQYWTPASWAFPQATT